MKCEHGNEVTILIELLSPPFWDDGIKAYHLDGTQHYDGEFLKVEGCEHCPFVRHDGG